METLILTCLQAQLIAKKVESNNFLDTITKDEIVFEIKKTSPKECKIFVKEGHK